MKDVCTRHRLKMQTLLGVRYLTHRGDYMSSFDLHDGFYALRIAQEFRDCFTINVRGSSDA
jgi:hypothetical protein